MMLYRFFLVIFLFIGTVFAQSGQIQYKMTIPNSSVNQMHTIVGYLYFDSYRSLFVFDRREDKRIQPASRFRDDYGQMVYCDKNTKTCFFRVFFWIHPYISQESIPILSWQMYPETKIILDKVCKKAITTFRGRTYTVWYTPSIPISIGPWKLQGLPGAILEAKSQDGQISFEADYINVDPYNPIQNDIPDDLPKKFTTKGSLPGEYVTFEEFKSTKEKEAKKTEDFFKNMVFPMMEKTAKEKNTPLNSTKEWKIISNNDMFAIEKFE